MIEAIGRCVGDDGEPAVLGEQPSESPGRRTAVEDDAAAGGRQQVERGSGDPVLLVGGGDVALGDGGLRDRERVGGHGTTVDPMDQALSFEYGQVAADGLGGDAERLGCLAHAEPAISGDEISDGALTLFGVQRDLLQQSSGECVRVDGSRHDSNVALSCFYRVSS